MASSLIQERGLRLVLASWRRCLTGQGGKRQLQFLLEGRGRRAGLSPEELRENGKLLGEGLSRALFNYPCRDASTADSPEEGAVESSERAATTRQYLQELVQQASDTNLKGEALHQLWPSLFAEMPADFCGGMFWRRT
ncbi:hypothetical protein CRUP_025588 [Coryphaenoides rupestris]|nr:hypothetical protein CRUP_025588 [Coryphaenoides rupestris]